MAPSTFQTALYKEYRALYVSPISQLAPRLNLLDVMIQTDSEGLVPRRPVLHRVGSMLDLGTNSSEPAQEKLRKGLESFWAGKGMMPIMSPIASTTVLMYFDKNELVTCIVCSYALNVLRARDPAASLGIVL